MFIPDVNARFLKANWKKLLWSKLPMTDFELQTSGIG